MLARRFRLSGRREFNRLFRDGRVTRTAFFLLRSSKNFQDFSRLSVAVPKKISKKAVVRNRQKRRVVETIQLNWDNLSIGYDNLIFVKTDITKLSPTQLQKEIVGLFKKAGIYHS